MKEEVTIRSSAAEYLTYISATGESKKSFEMRYENENIWLTQKMMVTLYDVDIRTINEHIKHIYADKELTEEATIRNFRIVQQEGNRTVSRDVQHYNLQMIIAVGFKVNNQRAVQFRKWANNIVKDYTIKGWGMDEDRLKNGGSILTEKYFEEQLEKICEIRISERKFYQKITDIYATAIDYDKTSKTTLDFFAKVQNKMHFAVHGHTAVELIYDQAYRHIPMTMEDWAKRLDIFLQADDRDVLQNAGKITAEIAKAYAETEFEKYRIVQDRLYESDFDRMMKKFDGAEKTITKGEDNRDGLHRL